MYTSEAMGPEDSASGRPGRSAPAKNQPKRSTPSIHTVQPGPKGKPAGPKKAPDQKPGKQAAPSEWEKAAIQKRAAGRTKVPPRFRDSIKRFFFSPTGVLKIVRLGLLIAALTCFIISEAQDSFIAITVLEVFIVILFILIYMLTLHHLLTYIHWPLLCLRDFLKRLLSSLSHRVLSNRKQTKQALSSSHWTHEDPVSGGEFYPGRGFSGETEISVHGNVREGKDLINSFITTVFLSVVAILTVQEKERRHLFYVGGSLCLSAAIVCLVDASLVTKMVRQVMKKALGMEGETTPSLEAETEAETAGEEPTQQLIPEPEPDKMLNPAASEPSTVGPSLAKEAATTP